MNVPFNNDFYDTLPSLSSCSALNYIRLFQRLDSKPQDLSFFCRFAYLGYLATNLANFTDLSFLLPRLNMGSFAFFFGYLQASVIVKKTDCDDFDLEIEFKDPLTKAPVIKRYEMQSADQAVVTIKTELNKLKYQRSPKNGKPPSALPVHLLSNCVKKRKRGKLQAASGPSPLSLDEKLLALDEKIEPGPSRVSPLQLSPSASLPLSRSPSPLLPPSPPATPAQSSKQ